MSKRLTFLSATAVSLALALPLAAEDKMAAESVIATVNGQEITLGHLVSSYDSLPQEYKQIPKENLLSGLVEQLVSQAVLSQTLTGDLPKALEYELENQRRTILASEAMNAALATEVTEEKLLAEYEATVANQPAEMEYSAAHILVESEEEAQKLAEEARGGADFAGLARSHSTGPSAPNGGDLGWFSAGMMVKPFEDVVFGLEKGAVSDPVQTQFGWHVIQLKDSREKPKPSFEELKPQIDNQLRQAAVASVIGGLIDKAEIDSSVAEGLDPEILTDLSIFED